MTIQFSILILHTKDTIDIDTEYNKFPIIDEERWSSADLEVQLVQLNHCDGEYSNYWNTLLRNLKLLPYSNMVLKAIQIIDSNFWTFELLRRYVLSISFQRINQIY